MAGSHMWRRWPEGWPKISSAKWGDSGGMSMPVLSQYLVRGGKNFAHLV